MLVDSPTLLDEAPQLSTSSECNDGSYGHQSASTTMHSSVFTHDADARYAHLKSWVLDDIEHAQVVEDVNVVLTAFLQMVQQRSDDQSPVDSVNVEILFEDSLRHVRESIRDNAVLQGHLGDYCNASSVQTRLSLFVELCNRALDLLRDAHQPIATLRPASQLDILLARNETLHAKGRHALNYEEGDPEPNVMITSRRVAQSVCSTNSSSRNDFTTFAAKDASPTDDCLHSVGAKSSLNWTDLLSAGCVACDQANLPYTPVCLNSTNDLRNSRRLVACSGSGALLSNSPDTSNTSPGLNKRTRDDGEVVEITLEQSVGDGGPRKKAKLDPSASRTSDTPTAVSNSACNDTGEETGLDEPIALSATPDPKIQLAACAASMLCRSSPAAHAISFSVKDELVSLWWCDRQGAIRVSVINIVQDLDHFLLLLLCLQRFDLEHWGFLPELDHTAVWTHLGDATGKSSRVEYENCTADLGRPDLSALSALGGRCTTVVDVKSMSVNEGFSGSLAPSWYKAGETMECIFKVSWVDAARTPEPELVEKVREQITNEEDEERVGRHLPWIVDWKDHTPSTARIRKLFNVKGRACIVDGKEVPTRKPQVLRSLVTEKLKPAEKLPPVEFFEAWLGNVGCIYGCWKRDVYYRDPSLNNSMYRTIDGKLYGVLNDFDLATTPKARYDGLERTGTIPFMALELLKYPSGQVAHHLSHDLEAEYWVLCWRCHVDPDAGEAPPPFISWLQSDYQSCLNWKSTWQADTYDTIARRRGPGWDALARVLLGLRRAYAKKKAEETTGDPDDEVFFDTSAPPMPQPVTRFSTMTEWEWFSSRVVKYACIAKDNSLQQAARLFAQKWHV